MSETQRQMNASLRSAYRARWNMLRRTIETMRLTLALDPDDVYGVTIDDLRSQAWDVEQSFHEFNAYRNAYGTVTGRKVMPLNKDDTP